MRIYQEKENTERFLDYLLMTGFREEKIRELLKKGELFVLSDNGVIKTVCIVEPLKNGSCQMRAIVTLPDDRKKGYGKNMLQYVCEHYSEEYHTMFVGVLVSADNIDFYRKCGFEKSWTATEMQYFKRTLDSIIDIKKVVDMALEAGRILLKNGAEIFRVEETITRICHRFHIDKIDVFTLSHAIFISAEDNKGQTYTRVKSVPLSSTHLGIVAEVNDLSRQITGGYITLENAVERLKEIENIPPESNWKQIVAAGISSGCLGFLLGGTALESVMAFFIGCILYVWVILAGKAQVSKIITTIVGGVVITGTAILFQQVPFLQGLRLEGMIGGAIMPLIPGVAFVNAIRDIADSDFLSGTVKMINAIMVFVYIAIGVAITLAVCSNWIGGIVL